MLETLLLAAIVAAPVGSASLFLPGRRRTRKAGAWSATRRLVLAVVGTVIIAYIVKAIIGLRPTEEVETLGLDLAEHGEEGYHGA